MPLIPYVTRPFICFNELRFTMLWQERTIIAGLLVMLHFRRRCFYFKTVWSTVEKVTHSLYNGLIRQMKPVLFNAWDIRGVACRREKMVKYLRLTANAWELAALWVCCQPKLLHRFSDRLSPVMWQGCSVWSVSTCESCCLKTREPFTPYGRRKTEMRSSQAVVVLLFKWPKTDRNCYESYTHTHR